MTTTIRLPHVMVDPTQLPEGDHWTWTCGTCHTTIQGGRTGLALHTATVNFGGQDRLKLIQNAVQGVNR